MATKNYKKGNPLIFLAFGRCTKPIQNRWLNIAQGTDRFDLTFARFSRSRGYVWPKIMATDRDKGGYGQIGKLARKLGLIANKMKWRQKIIKKAIP